MYKDKERQNDHRVIQEFGGKKKNVGKSDRKKAGGNKHTKGNKDKNRKSERNPRDLL